MTAQEIKKLIKQAIKKFGSYSYFDKGPGEVMDLDSIAESLKVKTVEEVRKILLEVLSFEEGSNKDSEGLYETFITSILSNLDDVEWFEELTDGNELSNFY